MTNVVKKGLLVLCLCLCSIIALGMVNAFAKPAHAANEAEFAAIVQELEDTKKPEGYKASLADGVWSSKIRNARSMYTRVDTAVIDGEVIEIYNAIMAEIEQTLQLYENMSVLYNKVNGIDGARVYGSEAGTLQGYIDAYNGLTDAEKTFITGGVVDYKSLTETALEKAKSILEKAAAAVAKIDAVYRNEADEIVLNSRDSLDAAKTAIDGVYGIDIKEIIAKGEDITAYITNYDAYLQAEQDYQDNDSKATAFIDTVNGILDSETEDVCYSLQSDVNDAKEEYNALPDDADNNLKALDTVVTAKENLDDLQGRINDVQAQIDEYVAKVNAIGEVDYDEAILGKIVAAENAYFALPDDTLNVDAVVSAHATEVAARNTYNTMHNEVDALIGQAQNFPAAYDDGTLSAALTAFSAGLSIKTEKQRNYVKAYEVAGSSNYTTIFTMYQYYNGVLNAAQSAANPVINKIAALPDHADVTTEFSAALTEAENAYAALEDEYKPYVTNYAKLTALRSEFDGAMAVVNEWRNKVASIEEFETATDVSDVATYFENIAAAVAEYEGLSNAVKEVIPTSYSDEYNKYTHAIANKDAIKEIVSNLFDAIALIPEEIPEIATANLDALDAYVEKVDTANGLYNAMTADQKTYFEENKAEAYGALQTGLNNKAFIETERELLPLLDAIALIPEEIPSVNDAAGLSAYVEKVDTANGLYEAMTADQKTYFEENKAEAYGALQTGLNRNIVISVENKIAQIGDVSITSEGKINDARTAYDAMTERQDEVENYDILTAAETEFKNITTTLNAWAANVSALRNDVSIEELWKVDLNAVNDLETEYAAFSDDEKLYSVVAAGRMELDAIKAKSTTRINDLIDRINNLPDVLTDDDLAAVEAIKADYNKLDETQQVYVNNYNDFETSYNKVIFVNTFEKSVADIKEQIENGNFVFEDKIELYILKSLLNSASDELQSLVSEQTKTDLNNAIAAYEDEETVIINVAEMKAALEQSIADVIAAYGAADAGLQGQIDELTAALADAINAYQAADTTLQNNINTAKTELTEAYTAAITALQTTMETADGNLQTALQNAITTLTNNYTAAINTLKGESETADANLQAALNQAIANLTATDNNLQASIDALNTTLTNAIAAYGAADEDLQGQIDELTAALADAIAKYKDADTKLQNNIDDAVANLQNQIDSLSKKSTITIIVFAVICVALSACVIVLFIKRKKA